MKLKWGRSSKSEDVHVGTVPSYNDHCYDDYYDEHQA